MIKIISSFGYYSIFSIFDELTDKLENISEILEERHIHSTLYR